MVRVRVFLSADTSSPILIAGPDISWLPKSSRIRMPQPGLNRADLGLLPSTINCQVETSLFLKTAEPEITGSVPLCWSVGSLIWTFMSPSRQPCLGVSEYHEGVGSSVDHRDPDLVQSRFEGE